MAKAPFLLPEANTGPITDSILDAVFGPVEGPTLDDIFTPDQLGTGSTFLDSDIALRTAMLDTNEEPLTSRYVTAKQQVKQSSNEDIVARLRDKIQSNMDSALAASTVHYGDRGDIEGGVQAAQRTQRPLNVPEHMTAATEAAMWELKNTDDPIQQAKIRRELLESQMAFAMEKFGILDPDGSFKWTDGWTLNKELLGAIAGQFFPGRNALDFSNVGEGANPISGWNAYKDKIFDFTGKSDRPLNEQVEAFEAIINQLMAETDNPFLFMERADAFIDPTKRDEVKWGLIFDSGDLALIGAKPALSMARFASLIARARKPIRIVRDMGKTGDAGKMAADAASNPKIAAELGTTPEDAIMAASPFPGGEFDPRIVNGIASETQQALARQRADALQPLNELDNLIMNRAEWTPAQKLAAQQKGLSQFAGKARKVDENEEGFTLEVDIEIPDPQGIKRSTMSRAVIAYQDAFDELAKLKGQPALSSAEDLAEDAVYRKSLPEGFAGRENVAVLEAQAKLRVMEENLNAALEELKVQRGELLDDIQYQLSLPGGFATNVEAQLARLDAIDSVLANPGKALDLDPTTVDMIPSTRRVNIKYTRDDWGALDSVEYSRSNRFTNSPSTTVHQQLEGAVSAQRVRDLNASTVLQALTDTLKNSVKGLLPSARRDVDAVLLQGDKDQKIYTVAELVDGIVTPEGLKRLTTVGQVNAYYVARDVSDKLWRTKNIEVRRALEIDGYRSAKIDGQHLFLDYRNPKEVLTGKTVLSLSEGKIVRITRKHREMVKTEGYKYYKLKFPHKNNAGETVTHVMARESDIGDIPENPLSYRVGYVPKVIDNTHFIGKIWDEVTEDGLKVKRERVVAFFDNFTDKDIWLAQNKDKGAVVESASQYLSRGSNKDDLENRMFGGLYEGERTDVPIQWNLTGKEGERVGAYEALEAYAGHVSTRVPAHIFKAQLITRFTNSAKEWGSRNLGPNQRVLEDPTDWQSKILLDPKSKEYGYFKNFQDWVKDQMRVTDPESRWFENTTNGIAHWIAPVNKASLRGKAQDLLSRGTLNISQKDVTGVMRAAAFHATLGWFNPVQLVVQGFGAATMFMMHPLKASRLMGEYAIMRATYLTKNGQAQLRTIKAMEDAGWVGAKQEEMLATLKAYQKSGLWQNTISTADHAGALARGDSLGMAAFKWTANKGLLFYREGERFSRTMAWLLARDEFAKGRKLLKYSDNDIDTITKMSQKYVFNLDRSNRAMWQKGLLSVPTQFMQIMSKFTEHMFYNVNRMESGWTATEKLKVGLGQAAMFGAAGIPFGQWITANLANWIQGKEIGGLGIEDPEVIKAVTDGAMGMLVDWGLGADVEFSGRVALPDGFAGLLADLSTLATEDPKLLDIMLGAFGEVPNRTVRAVGRLGNLFRPANLKNADPSIIVEVAYELGTVTSMMRNIRKQQIMRDTQAIWIGRVVDFEGKKLQPLDPNTGPGQVLAQLWGFQPAAIADYDSIVTYNRLTKQDEADTVAAILQLAQRSTNSNFYAGDKGAERFKVALGALVHDMPVQQQERVFENVRKKLESDDYALAKELITAQENFMVTEGDATNTGFGEFGSLMNNKLGR